MITSDDVLILARTIYGEARGEPFEGKVAVGRVVMNRVKADLGGDGKPDWWGEGISNVCLKPWQFSCWNHNDPNREKLISVGYQDRVFQECMAAALKAIRDAERSEPDPTKGATHYYLAGIPAPAWAIGRTPTAKIGRHLFFANVEK